MSNVKNVLCSKRCKRAQMLLSLTNAATWIITRNNRLRYSREHAFHCKKKTNFEKMHLSQEGHWPKASHSLCLSSAEDRKAICPSCYWGRLASSSTPDSHPRTAAHAQGDAQSCQASGNLLPWTLSRFLQTRDESVHGACNTWSSWRAWRILMFSATGSSLMHTLIQYHLLPHSVVLHAHLSFTRTCIVSVPRTSLASLYWYQAAWPASSCRAPSTF